MILIDTQKEEFSKLKDIRVFGRISHENRFNKNLLVIGLGGLGGRTVCVLKGLQSVQVQVVLTTVTELNGITDAYPSSVA